MEPESPGPYDLTKPEDLFHCIDTLTKARVSLSAVDPDLAAELASITDALIGLSASAQPLAGEQPRDFRERPRDLGKKPRGLGEQRQDVIVDVMTGEAIEARNKGFGLPASAQPEAGEQPQDFRERPQDLGEQRQDVIVDVLTGEAIGIRNKG